MADHFDVFMLTLGAARRELLHRWRAAAGPWSSTPATRPTSWPPPSTRSPATPQAILVTHGHFDHIGGVDALARRFARARLRRRGRRRAAAPAGHGRPRRLCRAGGHGRPGAARRRDASSTSPCRSPPSPRRATPRARSRSSSRATCSRRPALPGQRRAHRPARRLVRRPAQLDRRRSSAASRPTRSCTAATGPTPRWAASWRSTRSSRHCATTRSTTGERPESPQGHLRPAARRRRTARRHRGHRRRRLHLVRLPPDRHARVRRDRAVRARASATPPTSCARRCTRSPTAAAAS